MINVDDTVRIIAPGAFYGQIARVLSIDATSRDGHVWFRCNMLTLHNLPAIDWFEQKDIEEMPRSESEEANT